jgi:hypothetical protein
MTEGRGDPFAAGHPRRDPQVARGIRRVRLERGWRLLDVARLLGCDPLADQPDRKRRTRDTGPSGSRRQARRAAARPDRTLPAMRLPAPARVPVPALRHAGRTPGG